MRKFFAYALALLLLITWAFSVSATNKLEDKTSVSTLQNGDKFPFTQYPGGAGSVKNINWENIQQISGFDSSVVYNVKQYGAKGDGVQAFDGAITSGTPNFTSASASFTSSDVGKVITIQNAGGANTDLTTTISAYVSATAVTLATNASATVSLTTYTYGTDDTNALRAVLTAIGSNATYGKSATMFFPQGTYIVNGSFNQSNNSQLAFPAIVFANPVTTIKLKGSSTTASNGKVNNGSIIYGTKYGTNGTYSILSVTDSGGGGTGNIARINAVFEDIRFRTVQNPTHTAVDLTDTDQSQGLNVTFDTGSTYNSPTLPTHNDSYALKLPNMLAGNVSGGWTNLKIKTYYNGVRLGEHSLIWSAFIVQAVNAMHFYECRYPAQVFQVAVESVQNSVLVTSAASTVSYFKIYDLDIEHNTGTFANVTDLVDTSNLGMGEIHYSIFDNGGGSTFVVSGGNNVSRHNIKTNQLEQRGATGDHYRMINTSADSSTSGFGLFLLQNDGTAVGANSRVGFIGFGGAYNTSNQYVYGAAIQGVNSEAYTSTTAGTDLVFRTVTNGSTTNTERLRIKNDGSVGIGTSIPSDTLQVLGGSIRSAGYKSSDGSAGVTGATCTAWKNGLCTSL